MTNSIPQANVYAELCDLVTELVAEGMTLNEAYEQAQHMVVELMAYAGQWDAAVAAQRQRAAQRAAQRALGEVQP